MKESLPTYPANFEEIVLAVKGVHPQGEFNPSCCACFLDLQGYFPLFLLLLHSCLAEIQ